MNPLITGVSPQTVLTNPVEPDKQTAPASSGFADTLKSMLTKVNEQQIAGDMAIQNMQSGDANHLHDVMIAVDKADVSLRMLVQIRNKALTAYEEIMRMQI